MKTMNKVIAGELVGMACGLTAISPVLANAANYMAIDVVNQIVTTAICKRFFPNLTLKGKAVKTLVSGLAGLGAKIYLGIHGYGFLGLKGIVASLLIRTAFVQGYKLYRKYNGFCHRVIRDRLATVSFDSCANLYE